MEWRFELKSYIEKCLLLGFAEDEIRAVLRSVGWRAIDIENGIAVARLSLEGKKEKRSKKAADIRMLSADKSPNLLLPSPDQKFPAVVKTAIPLLVSLLSRRAESLKQAARSRGRPRFSLKLLPRPKREILAIAPAHSSPQLLLTAPSWQAMWLARFRLIVERVFSKIEAAAVIAGKIILLPIVILGLLGNLLRDGFYPILARYGAARGGGEGADLSGVKVKSSSPATMLIGEKFPEHIILFDIFKLAGRMFRTRRLRTFLTISGISVGIGTILFLVSFGYGLQNILFERITTEEALLTLDVVPPSDDTVIPINDALVERVSGIDGVTEVSKMIALSGEMTVGESSAAGFIYAVDPEYPRALGIKDAAVEFAKNQDRDAVIISSAAAKLLGWGDSPESAIGREVSFIVTLPKKDGSQETETTVLNGKFNIVGVADDSFSVFAYFPLEKLAGLNAPPYSQIKVKVRDTVLLEPVRDKILSMGLLVSMLTETVEQAKKVFNIVKLVLGLFGVVTLVVSAIGMLNTLTIALLERTQEVGIMKAVGASNFDIWKLFLAEAVIMGFLGGMGGIATGFISAEIFNYGINLLAKNFGGQALNLFQAPGWFVLTIVAFSSCIGIITGLWPARRAARLDPLDALKYK